jgi:hypothetical protein
MSCGTVPIKVDEVIIWQSTAKQLKEKAADCFAWTHERSLRLFASNCWLIVNNGEMLVDISNMCSTAYEAAEPQRPQEQTKTQPYNQVVWKYDIHSLNSFRNIRPFDVSDLFKLTAFKEPLVKVLETKQILLTTDCNIFSQLNELTEQRGVDVVFSSGSLSSGLAREAWRCIRMLGHFVDSGRKISFCEVLSIHFLFAVALSICCSTL